MSLVFVPLAILLMSSPARTTSTTLNVFAAASLKDAFTTISKKFEENHQGTVVALNFAGSQTLAAQIAQGAPADVFASASKKNLDDAKPVAASVRIFAYNRLTIIVRKGLGSVKSVKSLDAALKIVLADVSVPAGRYSEEFLAKGADRFGESWRTTVKAHVVSRETDVRSVLAKVTLGEADAGIVYVSDAVSAKGRVGIVPIPDVLGVIAEYPVGIMPRATNRRLAQEFVDTLFSAESRKTLVKNGFFTTRPRALPSGKGATPHVRTLVVKTDGLKPE